MTLSDQIRKMIQASGLTRYRIASEAGIAESSLSRFMAGSSLTTESLDKVAEVLRLRVVMDGPRKRVLDKQRR